MAKAYPQFVNYFDMAKETVVRCDEERPRFHAFLKVLIKNPCFSFTAVASAFSFVIDFKQFIHSQALPLELNDDFLSM